MYITQMFIHSTARDGGSIKNCLMLVLYSHFSIAANMNFKKNFSNEEICFQWPASELITFGKLN